MEEDKYYIPEISEFHYGFEYEFLYEGKWIKREWNVPRPIKAIDISFKKEDETMNEFIARVKDDETIGTIGYKKNQLLPDEESIKTTRVKYLSKEDIESFGYLYTELFGYTNKKYCIIERLKGVYEICHFDNPETVLFFGIIKNKSELIKIIKMIGINESS